MTTPPSPDPPDAGRSFRRKPDRQARDRSSTWRDRSSMWRDRSSAALRDQPRGLACAVIAAFAVLTAVAFVFAVVAVVSAMR
ncbi:hypothetical protein AB0C21_20500 [Spirillospora sp. NPDC049024]